MLADPLLATGTGSGHMSFTWIDPNGPMRSREEIAHEVKAAHTPTTRLQLGRTGGALLVRRTCATHFTDSCQGRASKIRLNGVCVAHRNRVNPPSSTITFLNRRSPACAPSAGPCRASDTGTQISDDAP